SNGRTSGAAGGSSTGKLVVASWAVRPGNYVFRGACFFGSRSFYLPGLGNLLSPNDFAGRPRRSRRQSRLAAGCDGNKTQR
ncbi:MAG: hypothetical protein ACPIOQ_79330, partial [Promethearchaeia archaeon]